MRETKLNRNTKETQIQLYLNIDGTRQIDVDTKIPFFDHMLTLMAFHGNFDLNIQCDGDIDVDDHHTIEDVGLVLGDAIKEIINTKKGLRRYSSIFLPMDESLTRIVLDISNRPYLGYRMRLNREKVGTMDTQNVQEFFKALIANARLTLHIDLLYGENDHHKIEAVFKAFGKALKEATTIEGKSVNSSKGVL